MEDDVRVVGKFCETMVTKATNPICNREKMTTGRIETTLHDRGKTYGKFMDNADISQCLKRACHGAENWHGLASDQKECVDMICSKLSRMLTGDPDYLDTWVDIQGFCKLVEDRIRGK